MGGVNSHVSGWIGLGLTFSKPILIALMVYLLWHSPMLGGAGIAIYVLCDILDGMLFDRSVLAKRPRLQKFRRYVDVIGDRIAIQVAVIAMITFYDFPIVLYFLITAREILLISIVAYSFLTYRPLRNPNNTSRIAAVFDACTAIAWLVLGWPAALVTALLMLCFGIIGLRRYYTTIQGTRPGASLKF